MRILIAVPSITLGSGLSKYILSLASLLINAGHKIAVVTTHTIDPEYEKSVLCNCGVEDLAQFGAYSKLTKYFKCWEYIRKFKADILINNYDGLVQILLPLLKGIKIVHVLHNDRDDFYRVGSINGKYVAGWIAPTRAIADKFNEYTHNKYVKLVQVIPHGVESGSNIDCCHTCKELIFVGVHHWHKGIKILPEIVNRLKKNGYNFHFTIVGTGAKSGWLQDAMSDHVKSGHVTFTGVITADEVYRLQAGADIFLYPTHTDAFGLVIAEAMMNATVPVITRLDGITDNLVDDGVNGFLLPQDDIEAFVQRISLLICDQELLAKMKASALNKAKTEFSLSKMSENYLTYLNLIK